jgi:Major intrinsic protein
MILSGKASGWNGALGQTTWSEYSTLSAFIFETVGTFLFLVCILGVTQRGAPVELAGIAIGLRLAAIHLVGINISGSSVNPARSLGPAMVGYAHNPEALKQIWLYILAPLIGAGVAGYLFRSGLLAAETVIPMRGEGESEVPPAASAPRDPRQATLDRALKPCALRMVASRFGGYRTLAKVRFGSKADIRVAMVGLLCAIGRNREGCRAFIKNDPDGCSVMPRQ